MSTSPDRTSKNGRYEEIEIHVLQVQFYPSTGWFHVSKTWGMLWDRDQDIVSRNRCSRTCDDTGSFPPSVQYERSSDRPLESRKSETYSLEEWWARRLGDWFNERVCRMHLILVCGATIAREGLGKTNVGDQCWSMMRWNIWSIRYRVTVIKRKE